MNLLIRGAHLVSGHRADILVDNGEIVGVESIPTAPARRKALTDYRWRQDIPCRGQSIDLDGTLLEAVPRGNNLNQYLSRSDRRRVPPVNNVYVDGSPLWPPCWFRSEHSRWWAPRPPTPN